jgi:hypothetical protein
MSTNHNLLPSRDRLYLHIEERFFEKPVFHLSSVLIADDASRDQVYGYYTVYFVSCQCCSRLALPIFPVWILFICQHLTLQNDRDGVMHTFLKMTNPSRLLVKLMYCSSSNSARSPYANRTGVLCVCHPVIVFGRPACPTTSTACPTRTLTVRGLRSSSRVTRNLGCMAVTSQ